MQSTSSLPESPEYITVIDRGISYTLNKKEDEAQQYAVIANMLKKQPLQFSTNGWSSAYKIVWDPQQLPRWVAQIIGVIPNSALTPEFVKTQNEQQIFYIPDPIVEPSNDDMAEYEKRIAAIMKKKADDRANKGKPPKPGSIKRGGRRTKHIRNKHNKTKSRRG